MDVGLHARYAALLRYQKSPSPSSEHAGGKGTKILRAGIDENSPRRKLTITPGRRTSAREFSLDTLRHALGSENRLRRSSSHGT